MAEDAITVENLTMATRSTDLVAGANMVSVATTDTFTISVAGTKNRTNNLVLVVKFSGTSTVTINAGAEPPSQRKGLGAVTFAGVNNEVRICPIDGGRHIQSTGTITGSNTGATVLIGAFRLPRDM